MKFKELPEGYYYIHAVRQSVLTEKLESPDTENRQLLFWYTQVVHDGRSYRSHNQCLDEMEVEFTTSQEMAKERKSSGARYGHIKRRLVRNEPLSGKSLDLALQLVGEQTDIGKKLIAGEPLGDYDLHYVVDVILVHARLA